MARPDYGRARWYGASASNYTNANRGARQISRIVIHVTQGSFSSAINWFKDSRANVSAHYTVRSSDGFIGQSVEERDIPWHAGNWTYNRTSIGIEHEGFVSNPKWFTNNMYRSSARLTAYLCDKYNIPIDRNHIVGHNEIPGATHTDPGRYWNWSRYMRLVRSYSSGGSGGSSSSYRQIVDNDWKRFTARRTWGRSSYSSQKYGKHYRYIKPKNYAIYANYKFNIPRRDRYTVFVRHPANSGYNSAARYRIRTAGGWVTRIKDQRRNGGRWVSLGTFTMNRGDRVCVKLSSWNKRSGYIIADAVMIKSA